MLREARRCGYSSVARRRRSEVLYPYRFNAVALGAGGGSCRLVLQGKEARNSLGSPVVDGVDGQIVVSSLRSGVEDLIVLTI